MPTVQQWWDKSTLSLQAARKCLEVGNLPAAANRLWYSVYQGAHAVLIHRGWTPRTVLANWAHEDIQTLYSLVVCRAVHTRAAKASLTAARPLVLDALKWRVAADYGDHQALDAAELRRAMPRITRVLEYIQQESLL